MEAGAGRQVRERENCPGRRGGRCLQLAAPPPQFPLLAPRHSRVSAGRAHGRLNPHRTANCPSQSQRKRRAPPVAIPHPSCQQPASMERRPLLLSPSPPFPFAIKREPDCQIFGPIRSGGPCSERRFRFESLATEFETVEDNDSGIGAYRDYSELASAPPTNTIAQSQKGFYA